MEAVACGAAHATLFDHNPTAGVRMKRRVAVLLAAVLLAAVTYRAEAHCDSMNGPVIKAAKLALEKGDVTPVLKWVTAKDEQAIRQAFGKTLAVRSKGNEARELADMYFFETLVRIHRAGEGEPYTGLKGPEAEVDPGIEAADKAVDSGDLKAFMKALHGNIEKGLHDRFDAVERAKGTSERDVESGRAFVAAYVSFIHYAESLFKAAQAGSEGHSAPAEGHHHE